MSSVYEKILRAAKRGTGTRLSPDEVWELSMDNAIVDAATAAEDQREEEETARREAMKVSRVKQPIRRKKLCGKTVIGTHGDYWDCDYPVHEGPCPR